MLLARSRGCPLCESSNIQMLCVSRKSFLQEPRSVQSEPVAERRDTQTKKSKERRRVAEMQWVWQREVVEKLRQERSQGFWPPKLEHSWCQVFSLRNSGLEKDVMTRTVGDLTKSQSVRLIWRKHCRSDIIPAARDFFERGRSSYQRGSCHPESH